MLLCKICPKTILTEGGINRSASPNTVEYTQATKQETLAVGDVRPKSKQMTPSSIAGALASCTLYDSKITSHCSFFISQYCATSQRVIMLRYLGYC